MTFDWLIVDGHSLLYRDAALAQRQRDGQGAAARWRLVRKLDRVAGSLARRITVVFDGRAEGGPGDEPTSRAVEILYSPGDRTADAIIERLVLTAPDRQRITVITSDRMERESVEAAGAQSLGCGDFLDRLDRAPPASSATPPPHTLGEHFPG